MEAALTVICQTKENIAVEEKVIKDLRLHNEELTICSPVCIYIIRGMRWVGSMYKT
jgi:hypothetical protein